MESSVLISVILSTTVFAFTLLIIYKHIRDLQTWRDEALMVCKRERMRQELLKYVSPHRQQMVRD